MLEQPASKPYVDAPILAGMDGVEHWSTEAASRRLEMLGPALPVPVPSVRQFCGGASNDVWDFGDTFLKVCWRADRGRMLREARTLSSWPSDIPRASVVDCGETDELSWVLTRRVPGAAFSDVASELTREVARDVVSQIATILKCLHEWQPDTLTRRVIGERPRLDHSSPLSVWASDLVPLPVSQIIVLAELARSVPFVDSGLIDALIERIGYLQGADPFSNGEDENVVVHGDASFGNWFVEDGRVTGLMDFEWVRLGPRDLDLVTPIFVAPYLENLHGESRVPYLEWLEEDYPKLFGATDLNRRLWLYEIAFFLRGAIWWPPDQPESNLQPDHHVHALRRLLDGPLPR